MREIKVIPPTREVALNRARDMRFGALGLERRDGRHDTGPGPLPAMPEARKGSRGMGLGAFSLRKPPGIRIVRTLSGPRPGVSGSRSSTLANTKQAKKRARQAIAHRDHHATMRSMVRSYIKKVVKAIG